MKKIVKLLCSFLITATGYSQPNDTGIAIIPAPVSVTKTSGHFILPQKVSIEAGSQVGMKQVVAFLKDRLSVAATGNVTVANTLPTATIRLQLNNAADNSTGKEGYKLSVTPKNILIKANEPAGLFYGVQTLVQLFPKEIESAAPVKNVKWQVPCVNITDYPRFGWRGLMFDVSRHFFN